MQFHKNLTTQAKLMIAEAIVSGIAGLIHAGLGIGLSLSFVSLHLRFDRTCHCTEPTVQQQVIELAHQPLQKPVGEQIIPPPDTVVPDTTDKDMV